MPELTFKLQLVGDGCVDGFTEDSLNDFINKVVVVVDSKDLAGFVTAPKNTRTGFGYDSNGNFTGITAKIAGKIVTLFPGLNGGQMAIYEGAPTDTYPGVGWEVDVPGSKLLFSQSDDQTTWKYFLARRKEVLNSFPSS